MFLAKKYGAMVYAVDSRISAMENYRRIREVNLEDLIIYPHANVRELPFADEYFDAVISVDIYHYFGNNDTYFEKCFKDYLEKMDLLYSLFRK